ncbi:MAG: glycine cleavage system protein GcvH [Candidatus Omnitrophota bacterium]
MTPQDLKYTESHEWVRVEGGAAAVGITHYAQEQLTDIVFVELPEIGRKVDVGDECAVIESCKVAAELYAPIAGEIVAVNTELNDHPEIINKDPFGAGWIVKIQMLDPAELDELMDATAYESHLENS